MIKYEDHYKIPKHTIRISLTYLVSPFAKRPHRLFEFYFFMQKTMKRAPKYFKQIMIGNSPTKLAFLSIFSVATLITEQVRIFVTTKYLFSQEIIFLSSSKKNSDVVYINKKRQ